MRNFFEAIVGGAMHCNLQIDGFLVGKIGVLNLHAAFGASVKLEYSEVSASVVS